MSIAHRPAVVAVITAVMLSSVGVSGATSSHRGAASAIFVVTSSADPGNGVCDAACTFREAIEAANSEPTADVIAFAIGTGRATITPTTALPPISDPVEIRGDTQPGFTGAPLIGLDGSLLGSADAGLVVQAPSLIHALGVRRFKGAGIVLSGAGGSRVTGCFVGTNAAGTAGRRNGAGILVTSRNNTIGGPVHIQRNVISGNLGREPTGGALSGFGILIQGPDSGGNTVVGNLIGTDPSGTMSVPNSEGITLRNTSGNAIGGAGPGLGNVLSGNDDEGIRLVAPVSDTVILGNYVGVDVTGSAGLSNRGEGIRVKGAVRTAIGGDCACGNVISANGGGIRINERSTDTWVQGNMIGVDATGTLAIGNRRYGVAARSSRRTLIGGTGPGEGNVISGNRLGLRISGDVDVMGNVIGTAADGVIPIGNADVGILIEVAGPTVGGTADGSGNVIAGNVGAGVIVQTGSGSSIRGNSFTGNTGLAIDLVPAGVTPNDAGDVDSGPNGGQNHPQVIVATTGAGGTTAHVALTSSPSATFAVDLYGSEDCDPSGSGEGSVFLGTAEITTDVAGEAVVDLVLPVVALGTAITATATDPFGSTSEFSPCVSVAAG